MTKEQYVDNQNYLKEQYANADNLNVRIRLHELFSTNKQGLQPWLVEQMGNGHYCYYSTCYGDEVFFPYLCEQAEFMFNRESTLALGAPACDMRFTRKR